MLNTVENFSEIDKVAKTTNEKRNVRVKDILLWDLQILEMHICLITDILKSVIDIF